MCALEEKQDDIPGEGPQSVLVLEFSAGIGSRALELAGYKLDHLVVIENDPECRRLNKDRPAKGSRD